MNLKPLGERVIAKPVAAEEKTRSGIVLPDAAKEKPQEAIVVAVGEGKLMESGSRIPLDLKEGDRIIYAKYAGVEFKRDGEEYLILNGEKDILAVIEQED